VVVDVRGIKPGRGDGGKKVAKDAGTALGKFVENESEAPASSARMARRPVPADGSRTTSAGVIAAATLATYANPIGVENC
jgi:xanthine/uracil permease